MSTSGRTLSSTRPPRGDSVLVSIVIANRNYARFLPDAIDSALAQDHPQVEVVVVDDGSTDASAEVIAGYGGRIVARLQDGRGQAAALNAGLGAARGELVCLLDADDLFLPDKVSRVVRAWHDRPDAALVHHQMQTVDADGRPAHRPWPSVVLDGDLRRVVRRSAGWYPCAPASGLSFSRAYVDRLLPLPTDPVEVQTPDGAITVELKPDTYLAAPAAFVGPICGVHEALARYRIHGANKSGAGADAAQAERWNRQIGQYMAEFDALQHVLRDRLGLYVDLRLQDHLGYQLHRRGLGEISRSEAILRTATTPTLPLRMRPREIARVAVGRGAARRIQAPARR